MYRQNQKLNIIKTQTLKLITKVFFLQFLIISIESILKYLYISSVNLSYKNTWDSRSWIKYDSFFYFLPALWLVNFLDIYFTGWSKFEKYLQSDMINCYFQVLAFFFHLFSSTKSIQQSPSFIEDYWKIGIFFSPMDK